MARSLELRTSVVVNGDLFAGGTWLAEAEAAQQVEAVIPFEGADVEVGVSIRAAGLEAIVLTCDRDVSIATNDVAGGSPQEVLTVRAGSLLVWRRDGGGGDLFAGDVTAFYVTNEAAEGDALLRVALVQDVTP